MDDIALTLTVAQQIDGGFHGVTSCWYSCCYDTTVGRVMQGGAAYRLLKTHPYSQNRETKTKSNPANAVGF